MLVRLLSFAASAVLLTGCSAADEPAGPPVAGPPASTVATPEPSTSPEPTTEPSPSTESRLVWQGLRLERITGTGEQLAATVTNLNDLPVEATLTVDVFASGGDFPEYELTGQARISNNSTVEVPLTERTGQTVVCTVGCPGYGFRAEVEQAEAIGEEPYNLEGTCSDEVCPFRQAAAPQQQPSRAPTG